jgi:hypothetical protein
MVAVQTQLWHFCNFTVVHVGNCEALVEAAAAGPKFWNLFMKNVLWQIST